VPLLLLLMSPFATHDIRGQTPFLMHYEQHLTELFYSKAHTIHLRKNLPNNSARLIMEMKESRVSVLTTDLAYMSPIPRMYGESL